MARTVPLTDKRDQALVHQFIRRVGHVPSAAELARYQQRTTSRVTPRRIPVRLRREAAQVIERLGRGAAGPGYVAPPRHV